MSEELKAEATKLRQEMQRRHETVLLLETRLSAEHAAIAHMQQQMAIELREIEPLKSSLESIEKELAHQAKKADLGD